VNDPLRAALDPVILALLDVQPDHGYSLMLRIREATGENLSDGSLYPALARLEATGKIEGKWSVGKNGRDRKVFSITPKGRGHLHRARDRWPRLAERVTVLLGKA
jgi:PadR family transcriptional regulator PadR